MTWAGRYGEAFQQVSSGSRSMSVQCGRWIERKERPVRRATLAARRTGRVSCRVVTSPTYLSEVGMIGGEDTLTGVAFGVFAFFGLRFSRRTLSLDIAAPTNSARMGMTSIPVAARRLGCRSAGRPAGAATRIVR
jgi:hypothetical protein